MRQFLLVCDADPVDENPVVTRQVFQNEGGRLSRTGGVSLVKARVRSRDVPLRETDGVPLLPTDGILVPRERNDRPLSFVVLNDKLPHGPSPSPLAYRIIGK